LEIPRNKGILKAKLFNGNYEHKLEFSEEWGCKPKKNPLWGEYGYFLEQYDLFLTNLLY